MNYSQFKASLDVILHGAKKRSSDSFEALVDSIPTVDRLNISNGESVLVRFDLDLPIHDGRVLDMARVEVGTKTIQHLQAQQAKIILFGHLGRDGKSLAPVCDAMSKHLATPITLVENWVDESTGRLNDAAVAKIEAGEPGSIFMLENTRKFAIERALWKKKSITDEYAKPLFQLAQDIAERLAKIEVNEAIAASNLDFSSAVLPLCMHQTAMGFYLADEVKSHLTAARTSQLVVVSGAKADKLQYIEDIVHGGHVKIIIAAGGLAMALLKAQGRAQGEEICIGRAESDQSYKGFLGPDSFDAASRVVEECSKRGVKIVLPIDYILDTEEVSTSIPPDRAQWDVGPKSREHFAAVVRSFIQDTSASGEPATAFYNGAFGIFEKPAFAEGTKAFIPLLGEMTKAKIRTYVGGGEGRTALLTFGHIDDVHHAFTAGGTVLKSLAGRIVPYVRAMSQQNRAQSGNQAGERI